MVTPSTHYQPFAGMESTSYTRKEVGESLVSAPYTHDISNVGDNAGTDTAGERCDVRSLRDAVMCGGGVRWRPQGGRGHDHPTQVQQRKAQTVCHFSPSHSTLSLSSSQIPVKSLTSHSILSTPWAIVTRRRNLAGSIIGKSKPPGGYSYPLCDCGSVFYHLGCLLLSII